MKLNSPQSIETARRVFRNYNGSWTAARAAGVRDENGVLVIPEQPPQGFGASPAERVARRRGSG